MSEIIERAYQEALKILGENIDGLTQLANKLIDKEVVFGDDLEKIFGKRPWTDENNVNLTGKDANLTGNDSQEDEKSEENK